MCEKCHFFFSQKASIGQTIRCRLISFFSVSLRSTNGGLLVCHKSPTPYTTLLNRGVPSIEATNTVACVTAGIICAREFKVLEEGLQNVRRMRGEARISRLRRPTPKLSHAQKQFRLQHRLQIQRVCEHFPETKFCVPRMEIVLESRCPKGEVSLHCI